MTDTSKRTVAIALDNDVRLQFTRTIEWESDPTGTLRRPVDEQSYMTLSSQRFPAGSILLAFKRGRVSCIQWEHVLSEHGYVLMAHDPSWGFTPLELALALHPDAPARRGFDTPAARRLLAGAITAARKAPAYSDWPPGDLDDLRCQQMLAGFAA